MCSTLSDPSGNMSGTDSDMCCAGVPRVFVLLTLRPLPCKLSISRDHQDQSGMHLQITVGCDVLLSLRIVSWASGAAALWFPCAVFLSWRATACSLLKSGLGWHRCQAPNQEPHKPHAAQQSDSEHLHGCRSFFSKPCRAAGRVHSKLRPQDVMQLLLS